MFDRLLGPKLDHADPKVRARAFGQESVETSTLNQALATENDADVLCVILGRASDVAAVLNHAKSGDGSIANEARTRLVALADSGSNASAEDWSGVYTAAREGNWSQMQALNGLLGPVSGREQVVLGALQSLPESHDISERVLFTLATQSGSAVVRRLAARKLHSRDVLEECSHELKDKDKTVYRELKERIDVFRLDDERRALAVKLQADCDALAGLSILAQPEAVAVAQARMQTLEQRVAKLNEQSPGIAQALVEHFAKVSERFGKALQVARSHVDRRKETRARLSDLNKKLSGSDSERADDHAAELESIKSSWEQTADHSDLEQSDFERDLNATSLLVQQDLSDRSVTDRLETRLEHWESRIEEKDSPSKLLQQIRREWDSAEKPRNPEQLSMLAQRVDALIGRLDKLEVNLAKTRETNSKKLLKVLADFVSTMEKGEFKKAMSLNDKLKARSANQELESAAKRRIEEALKQAQPKLEEFRKWRHFGTQQARETLIGQANTLASDPPASPKALATAVKELREAWRKLDQDDGRASEAQWQTFSKACKEAYKPAKKHFDQLAKDRKKNLAGKKTILEALEKLLGETDWDSPDWSVVTRAHKDLVIEWQRSGTVDYKFKKELDAAFESVNARLDEQFKDERENEVLRRRRIIDNLKSLKDSETGGKLASAAKRAQRNWRPTVQSGRKTEQALWEEFRGVCDEIFGALKQQQKDTKAAWQADAAERESVCEQIDALLAEGADSADDADRRAANQASGQLREYAKSWRQRHQIPASVMAKLDARYKLARSSAEKRIATVIQQDEKRAIAKLDTLLGLCQSAEECLLEGEFDKEKHELQAPEFEAPRGAAGKALLKRYTMVLKGMGGDAGVAAALREALSDNAERRQELCLLGELVTDIESPAHADEERMALKMKRLTEAMQGELPSPEKEIENIINEWYTVGGVAASDWPELNRRFALVRSAQGGKR